MHNLIKDRRIKLNITQEDLARQARVRRETIVFLEQGKYNPSLKLAHDVAKALKTTIDKLFIFDD
ncbi:MAG: helix-turn-helix transcriptional regulator [Patescibacteria group bacterium]|jgi:putative transcriptional regulator|nr:helix-turn-helix transcriptional regulator [Patescibacteria group bacterium]